MTDPLMPLMPRPLLQEFADLIARPRADFTGREWVFAAIDTWLADPKGPSFFIITGEPGIGKTAIAVSRFYGLDKGIRCTTVPTMHSLRYLLWFFDLVGANDNQIFECLCILV